MERERFGEQRVWLWIRVFELNGFSISSEVALSDSLIERALSHQVLCFQRTCR